MEPQQTAAPILDDDQGVVFPVTNGQRSTTATGRAVFADAARAVDADLAAQIEAERDWRNGYMAYARRLLEVSVTTPHPPSAMAQAGLESLHSRFIFARDGDERSLADAVRVPSRPELHTAVVRGENPAAETELSVPYRGQRLRGDRLHAQLDAWLNAGVIEPSFAEAIRDVMANRDWLDLSDVTVAVLGEIGRAHV